MKLALVAVWAALQISCGAADEQVLARVGAEEITAGELRRFKAEMPAVLRSEKEGAEELGEYLKAMVDMELMLLEARSRGLEQTPAFLEKWEEERQRKLIAAFLQRHIQEKIDLPPEELQRRFAQSKWRRMLKLAHIRVKTEAEARQVMAELESGRQFEEVARERSVYQQTAAQGGLLDPYFGRGNIEELGMPLEIAEQVFELEVGQVGGPFPLLDGYELFEVVDERPAPASYGIVFAQTMFMEAFYARKKEVLAELKERFAARLDQEGLGALVEKAAGVEASALRLEDQERDWVLCRFAGGQITAGEWLSAYQRVAALRPIQFDRSGVAGFVEEHLLPEALMCRAALQEKLEEDPAVAAWLKAKKNALLVEELKAREVDSRIDLGEAALRQYYAGHQERFIQPEEIQVVELLATTEVEAAQFHRRARGGEDLGALAQRHSIRAGAASARGVFHMHPFERLRYKELLDEAQRAPLGRLQGPVQTTDGYSVFEVLAKRPARPQPFEQAVPRVKYWLRQEQQQRLFAALLAGLREQYRPRIVLFEDRLLKMADADAGA